MDLIHFSNLSEIVPPRRYLFAIDVVLNEKGRRLKNHFDYIIPVIQEEGEIDIDTVIDKIEEEIGGEVVADFNVKKVETCWDGNKVEVGDIVCIRVLGISGSLGIAEVRSVFPDRVIIETKNQEIFTFDRETGSRTVYDDNRINYTIKYIEKAEPIETKEWKEYKEKRRLKAEIIRDLENLNLDTLKIIKEIIERDRN